MATVTAIEYLWKVNARERDMILQGLALLQMQAAQRRGPWPSEAVSNLDAQLTAKPQS